MTRERDFTRLVRSRMRRIDAQTLRDATPAIAFGPDLNAIVVRSEPGAAWVVLSAQMLMYLYWDLAQRETFFAWFLLPGIGLQLVREGERLLREAGAQRIAAIVLTDRDPAMGFWAAAGYELQVEATRFTKLV